MESGANMARDKGTSNGDSPNKDTKDKESKVVNDDHRDDCTDMVLRRDDGALPGENAVNEALVLTVEEGVLGDWQTARMELCVKIATRVLATFFDNDLELYEKKRHKHASYAELRKRLDDRFTRSEFSRFMGVFMQIQDLPKEVGEQLSYSNHCTLLPVKDIKLKRDLAKLTVEKGLTTEELKAERARLESEKNDRCEQTVPRVGRPPLHPWVKGGNWIMSAVLRATKQLLREDLLEDLTVEQAREALGRIERVMEMLEPVRNLLAGRLQAESD